MKYQIGTRKEVGKSYIRLGEFYLKTGLSLGVVIPMVGILQQTIQGKTVDVLSLSFLGHMTGATYFVFLSAVGILMWLGIKSKNAGVEILESAYLEESKPNKKFKTDNFLLAAPKGVIGNRKLPFN